MLTVEVRDAALATTAVADNFTTLTATSKFMDVGVWVLEVPTGAPELAALLAPGAGIVVRDGAQVVFSGPADTGPGGLVVMRRELAVSDTAQTDVTVVSGSDDMVWLADRVAHPSPLDGNPANSDYDTNTGPATSVLWDYVNDNCGPGAIAARRVPLLAMAADPATGPVFTAQARWQNLLVWLASLAAQGGVTVTAAQDGGRIVVTVAPVADLTAAVILSPRFGDLADVVYQVTRSTATAVYLGAQGDLADRVTGTAALDGVRRVETFVDRRDISDPAEVPAVVAAALADATGTVALSVVPAETDSYRYGTDYHLGDSISVDVDGSPVPAQVTSTVLTVTAAGPVRTVGVGNIATPIEALYRTIANLSARITQLERT